MIAVQEHAKTTVWLFISAALTGCVAPSGQSSVSASSGTASGVFVSVAAGVAKIDPDTLGNVLEVDEDVTPAIRLGVGYQISPNTAVEVRVGDLGSVEFTDGRELDYQVVDASGLYQWRQRNTSIFARLGVGTFNNDGDFDVDQDTPAHVVFGGGLAYHITPSVDVRLAVSAHGGDAVVGNAGLVWRFGARPLAKAPAPVATTSGDDGFEAVAPVQEEVVEEPLVIPPAPRGGVSDNGLVIDEKPIPTLQTFPEPTVPDSVSRSTAQQAPALAAPVADSSPSVQPVPAPEVSAAPVPVNTPEELFVVDTLLSVRALQFEQGAATLLAASEGDLVEVAGVMEANPGLRLQVESHAAPVGNADLNMLLSRRRALTVIRLLVEQGIEAKRLRPRAFGDTAPVAGVDSINENDRVEFRIR